jgi:hypothetical protein
VKFSNIYHKYPKKIKGILWQMAKNAITKTGNYSIPAVDLYDFGTLNQHVVAANTMLNTANSIFGQNSETYKIAEFLSRYFSYFESWQEDK